MSSDLKRCLGAFEITGKECMAQIRLKDDYCSVCFALLTSGKIPEPSMVIYDVRPRK